MKHVVELFATDISASVGICQLRDYFDFVFDEKLLELKRHDCDHLPDVDDPCGFSVEEQNDALDEIFAHSLLGLHACRQHVHARGFPFRVVPPALELLLHFVLQLAHLGGESRLDVRQKCSLCGVLERSATKVVLSKLFLLDSIFA